MFSHHRESIRRVTDYFQQQPGVRALLLGGSVAHGFAKASSDVDVMIIVSLEEYERRAAERQIQFFNQELCTYSEGYVDGKYITEAFLGEVEQRGSEPARFAFQDSMILFSHIDGLAAQLQRITQYPLAEKTERIARFHAQFEAWRWYLGEGAKHENSYLAGVAAHKMILHGSRMMLAHNELLYPYHKWLLAVLERAPEQPEGLRAAIETLSQQPTPDHATRLYRLITDFRTWEIDATPWPNRFIVDSELTWMRGESPVDDL